ncbi:MAG TPA: hypothetical protein ENH21_05065 [Chromatiales bacterium]|nr:hypothetical protein [Chromatiales bacterium]HEX22782.1 hypothetical protein [Chromatiales bacterium]
MAQVNYQALPFTEAINYFRQKVNLPTRTWTDIYEGMHARAFVVAGAMKAELLTDLRSAVDKAIADGVTLKTFREDFDGIVKKHGWPYKGGRNWRTRVIYDTNVRQAYNAGREKQMQDPALRAVRPYGLYKHGDSAQPRPEHLALDGTVLPLDDPWWGIWTPSNGWGCQCKKFTLSKSDAKARNLPILKRAPPIVYEQKTIGIRGPNPRMVTVPKGIDPGFAYNPGTAAWGRQLSDDVMASYQAQKAKAFTPLTFGGPETFNRPDKIPLVKSPVKLGPRVKTNAEATQQLRKIIGGDEKIFNTKGLPILVNAKILGSHIDPNRSEYLPLINDALTDPYEVWISFEQHNGTGQVYLRSRIIKGYDLGKGKSVLIVANAVKGILEAWTFIPTSKLIYANKQRSGQLLYGKE